MGRSPLLSSILAALALSGCGRHFETEMCVDVADDAESCPARADVDPADMFSFDECDIEAVEVLDDGSDPREGFSPGDLVCCYQVVAVDYTPNSTCQIGRPCVQDGAAQTAPVVGGAAWGGSTSSSEAPPDVDPAVLAAWAEIAALEHGSVAAFARLTLALLRLGAPPDILAAVQAAAADEVHHAEAAFAVASRLAGRPLAPGAFPAVTVPDEVDLVALAVSTWREGCVGETLGALLALEGAARATDPAVRATLARIAADESRHAALSWRIVGWAVATGGDLVREAIRAAAVDPVPVSPAVAADSPRAEAWGCLGPAATEAVLAKGQREVIAPALAVLLA